ncbi:UNVERIFIED_CONTAM: hypothetical protein FKN15_010798 [Acipenser sinensis]
MKFILCCLVVIATSAVLGAPVKDNSRALLELSKAVKRLQNDHTLKDADLYTPYDVENECLVPALWCFVDNLHKLHVKSRDINIITVRMPKRINAFYIPKKNGMNV